VGARSQMRNRTTSLDGHKLQAICYVGAKTELRRRVDRRAGLTGVRDSRADLDAGEQARRSAPELKMARSQPRAAAKPISFHSDRAAGEKRPLTITFCDLVDSTTLVSRVDPEEEEIVRSALDLADKIARGFGGRVTERPGDGTLVCFGFERLEDAAERAIRAPMQIVEAARNLPPRSNYRPLKATTHSFGRCARASAWRDSSSCGANEPRLVACSKAHIVNLRRGSIRRTCKRQECCLNSCRSARLKRPRLMLGVFREFCWVGA